MQAISVETDQGNIIHIEVADPIPAKKSQTGGQIAGGGAVKEKIKQLADVGDAIADVCQTLQERIQASLTKAKPSELTLEFSITLAGETGLPLVTKASAEGSFQVTAKWSFNKDGGHV